MKKLLRWICYFMIAIGLAILILFGTTILYGIHTDCPNTAFVYIKC